MMFAVLLYHGVDSGEAWQRPLDSTDREYILDRRRFEQHIQTLERRRTAVRLLDECVKHDGQSEVPVVLTFDDGDLSCHTTAAPVLERFGFRGEFFVVSRWVGQPGFMTQEQLRDLVARGHRINSHSQTHPKLSALDVSTIEAETAGSKKEIEAMIGTPVRYFSVPGGAYDQRVIDAARRAGYAGVLISAEGYNDGSSSPFVLRRFTARSYTGAGALNGITGWPRYTSLRIALKRGALYAAKRIVGRSGYERVRGRVVSRKMRSAVQTCDSRAATAADTPMPGVLMVTGAYYPELSGAGLQCRELVRQLKHSVCFTVLTTSADPSLPGHGLVDDVPVHRVLVDPSRLWSKMTAALRLTRIVLSERRRFSILHVHGYSQKSMLLVLLALLTGKHVATKLTSVGYDDPESMKKQGRLALWCNARARVFFGVSPRLEAIYAASGLPRERFRLIPNGVDIERFRPASPDERRALRAELGLPVDGTIILFVGFFSREKCPDLLFDAWSRLAVRGEQSSALVFVGATRSGYYEVDEQLAVDIRERASRLDLDKRLHFVEATRQIEQYHRAADIFALPSVREGLPNALLEAMACGAGCIATRLEGVTDTLIDDGDSGILVPPRDGAALEAALARLLSEPDLARTMGARARQRIEQDFTLAQTAQKYLAVYRELLPS